jgi:hemerythrin
VEENFVTWNDSFSVGFEPIDNQHKELVAMTNELFQGCKGDDVRRVFLQIYQKAAEYAQKHFADEEKYMVQASYPDLTTHRQAHRVFVNEVIGSIQKYQAGNVEPIKLAMFLKDWLLNHIAVVDKAYAPYLKKISP